MRCLDDIRFRVAGDTYKPLIIGGMGVDISTKELALAAANFGAVGHISDAMIQVVADRHLDTSYVSTKRRRCGHLARKGSDRTVYQFDPASVREAACAYADDVMRDKTGTGAVFANCMEKLTMNGGREILSARLNGLLDGGVDGITLSAGLHLGSFALMKDHPRFRNAKLGIIVSSARALKLFLMKSKKTGRLPDYVIVEGPLAGGHLGFCAEDLETQTLERCVVSVSALLKEEKLSIPIIAAGGIFSGDDALQMTDLGASAVQVATRFTIAKESGFPPAVKQAYIRASQDDIVVRNVSPTGYLMRLLKMSPALLSKARPQCEALGYMLSSGGRCRYADRYSDTRSETTVDSRDEVMCMCNAMRTYRSWTCGASTYRLKETVRMLPNGLYELPSAEEILREYSRSNACEPEDLPSPVDEEKTVGGSISRSSREVT